MNNKEFFDTATLQYWLKNMTQKVREFESGERYIKMRQEFLAVFREKNQTIKSLKDEIARAHAETVTVRKNWSEVVDDLDREHCREMRLKEAEIQRLHQRVLEVERQRDNALDKLKEKNRELYEVKTLLDEANQKIIGLTARINKDYTNSSKSSSLPRQSTQTALISGRRAEPSANN